jgi:hypothetical protein
MIRLSPYLEILENLRGIRAVRASEPPSSKRLQRHDASLSLRTPSGTFRLLAVEYKSHLSRAVVDHLIARFRGARDRIVVLAPHIGAGVGAMLAEAGINYVDRHGNCHLAVDSVYIHVAGRTGPPHAASEKGLRSPGYQVLFAYLAEPALLDRPLRAVAEWAGVSRQPASDVRQRLLEDGYIIETRKGYRWVDRRRDDALNMWLRGYETTVRASLVRGTYRTQTDPDELEKQIVALFPKMGVSELRWGGTTAAYRLTSHYRGARTTVHVHATPRGVAQHLRAVSDPRGNLVVMDAFGAINWEAEGETVHPLLVYSEMLRDGDERAREAAEMLFDSHIRPAWEAAP